ncbi:heavy metal translocating P-type ATPase [Bifidobacterium platyrrhinorum]|uniref:Heavy metal translocating P-type ATPase n=1 Tax=Bifidobacterium platyrrhinorum TaxID=2661628 RepID=A0A6L9SVI6_9BIFI|nr:heavy metal translocating P-type ATPase [Bifidobacterium platyrrhinorum]NEG56065.1 heavy metal translocating P-type ATPase [Bifidobacterium platyrrhinorum]
MSRLITFFTHLADLCRRVPMLPIVVLSAIPVAVLWNLRPWGAAVIPAPLPDPSIGQWVVVALVAYTVAVTVIGMIDDIRHGHVGVDLLAVLAMLSTLAVGEYWASWAVVLMVTSGEAIEEYAQSKAEHSLTALLDAAPRAAHVANLPGVGRGAAHGSHASDADAAAAPRAARNIAPIRDDDGFRHVTAHDVAGMRGSAASARRGATGDVSGARDVCALTGRDPESCDPAVVRADARVRPTADARFDTVPVEEVRLGDVVIVLPGETVPVDGELLSGAATLDLSAINGEPVPREVYAGARVMSGAVNGSTTLAMRATQVAADSQYQRILALVSQAQESRPAVVRTADRLAVPFTALSLLIAGVAWAVAGTPLRFAQVLVLATPCPLLIAAPVAYIAGTSRLAAAGVLIKTQDVIEQLGRVTRVFFDKTGTLTVKQPRVVRVEMVDSVDAVSAASVPAPRLDEDHVLMFAGVVESYSVHVLAQGIAAAGREALDRLHARYAAGRRDCPENAAGAGAAGVGTEGFGHGGYGRDYPVVTNVKEEPGKGISAAVNGHEVRVGRLSFAAAGEDGFVTTTGSAVPAGGARFGMLAADEMASYVAVDGRLVARIVLRDVPRANAKAALAKLHQLGVAKLVMLTGDKRASAEIIAREVGIDEVHAELFPEDKVAAVRAAAGGDKERGNGGAGEIVRSHAAADPVTMMVGDGVNDAPVLAAAGIGVAMTDGTSTAASESAQVVVMNDDIAAVPRAIAIARRTKRVMLQAVVVGLALAVVGMVAAAFDLIPVVVGAFLQEGIDVVSILWALTAVLDRD